MSDQLSTPEPETQSSEVSPPVAEAPTPRRCFTGALMSAGFTFLLYLLTKAVSTTLANVPLPTNTIAINISIAVRTLVIGVCTLATCIFGVVALGLVALGIQLLFKKPDAENSQ